MPTCPSFTSQLSSLISTWAASLKNYFWQVSSPPRNLISHWEHGGEDSSLYFKWGKTLCCGEPCDCGWATQVDRHPQCHHFIPRSRHHDFVFVRVCVFSVFVSGQDILLSLERRSTESRMWAKFRLSVIFSCCCLNLCTYFHYQYFVTKSRCR